MKKVSLSLVCLLMTSTLSATEPKKVKKIVPLGPVHGTTGIVVPKDTLTSTIKSIFIQKDRTYDGNNEIVDPKKRDMNIHRYNIIFRYGLGYDFDIRFIVPAFKKEMDIFNPKAKVGGGFKNTGTGDMRIFLRYQITSQQKGDSFFSAIDLGLELPTGDASDDFYFKNGKKLPDHNPKAMQLGDGSIDPILGLSMTKLMKRHRFDVSAMYFFNQKGDNDFQKGDQLNYGLNYSFMLYSKFMPNIELNGKFSAKNRVKDVKQDETGGHEIFLTPGFTSHLTKSLKFFAGYSFPIYRDLNRGSLGTDSIITVKLAYKW